MGDHELPTSMMMEKQKVVIDQLKNKLDLDLENFNKLTYVLNCTHTIV